MLYPRQTWIYSCLSAASLVRKTGSHFSARCFYSISSSSFAIGTKAKATELSATP